MRPLRPRLPQENREVAAGFLRDEARDYHKALSIAPVDKTCSPALRDLQDALEAYNATADESRKINLRACTFDEVLAEIESQKRGYSDKGRGPLNAGRNGLRIVGDYAHALSPWLDLVPSTMGLSFLNAGLKIVLSIASENAQNREKIFNAFHDIVHLILNITVRQDQFASVQLLRDAATTLYTTLVKSLADLIYLLHGNKSQPQSRDRLKRLGQKLLVPAYQTKAIDDILTAVERGSADFRTCLDVVNSQVSIETYRNTTGLLSQTTSIQANTETINDAVGQIAGGLGELRDQSRSTAAKIDEVRDEFRALRADQYRRQHEATHSQGAWIVFAVSDMPDWWGIRPSMPRTMSDPAIHTFLTHTQLFQCMQVSPKSIIDDVDVVLQQIGRIDGAAHMQAQQLLSSQEFFCWIGPSRTETLYVQGNLHTASAGRISALSAVCAILSLNLFKSTDSVVLHFTCGLHEAPENPIAGPNGLIRSLIAQLLLAGLDFNLDFISTRVYSEQIKAHDLPALTHTFRCLIESLPCNITVIRMIDGLVRFESESGHLLAELADVIHTLNQIVCNPVLRPVFKLLVTTPFARSRYVGDLVQARQTVTLRASVVSSGHAVSERIIGGRRDRLREYRAAMERGMDSDDDDEEDDSGLLFP
ncbi:hypothetical protein BJY00DRAFT_322533 [Aspergillus carlsbadensis]|nr:hypothetical protein BJY00DRAFT_322533 [Aspergillus carlsbadensis]